MTTLKRGFLDCKRLICLGLNKVTREVWLKDYAKVLASEIQNMNSKDVLFQNETSGYVLYNGQKLTLKTFVDDQVDIIERRSIINENDAASYSFYGSVSGEGNSYTWEFEYDPNPTAFYGYSELAGSPGIGSEYIWVREIEVGSPGLPDINPALYGYIQYLSSDYLIDVDDESILDSYEEFIYTLESDYEPSKYYWVLESIIDGYRINILIHNDIFTTLSTQEVDTLKGKLKRYIQAPYDESFGVEGYN